MPQKALDTISADSLPPDQIEALKELERKNRDLGAHIFLKALKTERGPFHHRAEVLTLLHHLSPQRRDRVLDAGAGVGRMAMYVAPQVAQLVCVDLSPASLQVLDAEAARLGINNINTVQADL